MVTMHHRNRRTDGRTDGRTDRQLAVAIRALHSASHGKIELTKALDAQRARVLQHADRLTTNRVCVEP